MVAGDTGTFISSDSKLRNSPDINCPIVNPSLQRWYVIGGPHRRCEKSPTPLQGPETDGPFEVLDRADMGLYGAK